MFASWRVGIIFSAANMTGHAFSTLVSQANNAERAVDGSSAALTRLKTIGMAAFATVGVLGVGVFMKAADAAGKYQLQMSLLQQQLGATDGQMEAIGKRIVSLSSGSSRTMFSMTDLSTMARSLQQSGLDAGAVERLIQPVAFAAEIEKLRHGGHLDPGTFAANIGSTIKGLGLGAPGREKDADAFAREFTAYASISKMDAAGLLAYENQFGMISRQAGWKADDFLTAGAFFSQMGVKPQMIGTMMKNIVTNLTPRATLTGHAETAQFMGLMNMGMLTKASPEDAKKYLAFVQANEKKIGLPQVDPSKMTAAQQEILARALLRGSVSSAAMGGGLEGLATLLHNAYLAYESKFGEKEGQARYARDARNVFNLRGLPAAIALGQGGPAALADLHQQMLKQVPLDARAAMLRGQYEPMKEMFGGMMNTVMVQLGGVTAGGKVTAGGPLDIATKVLQQVESLIGRLTDWSAKNPVLIAQIGTLIGLIGVGGLVTAGVAAAGMVVGMIANLAILAPAFAAIGAIITGPVGIIAALGLAALAIVYFSKHSSDFQHYITKAAVWITITGANLLSDALHTMVKNGINWFLHGYTPDSKEKIRQTLVQHPGPKGAGWNPLGTSIVPGSYLDQLHKGWVSNNITRSIVVPYSREYTKKKLDAEEAGKRSTTYGNQTFKIDVHVQGLSTPEVVAKIEKAIMDGVMAAARRGSGMPSTMSLLLGHTG